MHTLMECRCGKPGTPCIGMDGVTTSAYSTTISIHTEMPNGPVTSQRSIIDSLRELPAASG